MPARNRKIVGRSRLLLSAPDGSLIRHLRIGRRGAQVRHEIDRHERQVQEHNVGYGFAWGGAGEPTGCRLAADQR